MAYSKSKCLTDCSLEQPNDVEEDELIVATMQNLLPLVANRDRIFQLMRECFPARRQWIKETNPTVLAILTRYPRFTDTAGLVSMSLANEIVCSCLLLKNFLSCSVHFYRKLLQYGRFTANI
jgi:hypothetical protein